MRSDVQPRNREDNAGQRLSIGVDCFGQMIAVQIDGMDGCEACYCYAGEVGVSPKGLTLRRLFAMADARSRKRRGEMLEQAMLVWALNDYDPIQYVEHGRMQQGTIGKPIEYPSEIEAAIQAEIERQKQEGEIEPLRFGFHG